MNERDFDDDDLPLNTTKAWFRPVRGSRPIMTTTTVNFVKKLMENKEAVLSELLDEVLMPDTYPGEWKPGETLTFDGHFDTEQLKTIEAALLANTPIPDAVIGEGQWVNTDGVKIKWKFDGSGVWAKSYATYWYEVRSRPKP